MKLEQGKWYTRVGVDGVSTIVRHQANTIEIPGEDWVEIEPLEIKPVNTLVKDAELKVGTKIRAPESETLYTVLAEPVYHPRGDGYCELFLWLGRVDGLPMTSRYELIRHWIVVGE